MNTWLSLPENSGFGLNNIPFGIITYDEKAVPATRIGDQAVDLSVLADFGFFDHIEGIDLSVFYLPVLNEFIALGKTQTNAVRNRIQELFSLENTELQMHEEACRLAIHPIGKVTNLMPVQVGDYTDFYSSIEHATNVGIMFRDPANALLPNWRHLPVGYHGRSSSIIVSPSEVRRPKGQTRPDDQLPPVFGPSKQLDFELEMAFITNAYTELGKAVSIAEAEKHIFGLVVFNDLSARDIQKWEYVPLGPFLSKSFASVISPWIVTLEALEPFRVSGPDQQPEPLPYLKQQGKNNYDIDLEVFIKPEGSRDTKVCASNFKYMYWSMAQQLAHQTVAGCNIRPGDMYGSGTISGPTPDSFGSMLELSWKGTKPIAMPDGTKRTFLADLDTVTMKARASNGKYFVEFGDCIVKIFPAYE